MLASSQGLDGDWSVVGHMAHRGEHLLQSQWCAVPVTSSSQHKLFLVLFAACKGGHVLEQTESNA